MYLGDSRAKTGPGLLPLQDHGYTGRKIDAHNRACLLGVRVTGRDVDGSGLLGHWFEDPETRGDVIGALVWERSSRSLAGWSWVFPAAGASSRAAFTPGEPPPQERPPRESPVSGTDSTGARHIGGAIDGLGGEPVPTRPASPTPLAPPKRTDSGNLVPANEYELFGRGEIHLLPTRGVSWSHDSTFARKTVKTPQGWPDFPGGSHGLVVMGTGTDEQREQWHPTDPRLFAVHVGSPPSMGSIISDLIPGGSGVDTTRQARVHSFLRVLLRPEITRGVTRRPGQQSIPSNSLAWILGDAGQGDCRGGFVQDRAIETTMRAIFLGVKSPWSIKAAISNDADPKKKKGDKIIPDPIGGLLFGINVPPVNIFAGPINVAVSMPSGEIAQNSHPFGFIQGLGYGAPPIGAGGGPGGAAASNVAAWFGGADPRLANSRAVPGARAPGPIVLAAVSVHDGGPFDVGGVRDPHNIGRDGDGNPINPLHLSTEALFRRKSKDTREDGPLEFGPVYSPGYIWDEAVSVHLGFDPGTRMWRWWASTFFREDPPPKPPPPPRTPPTDGPPSRRRPDGKDDNPDPQTTFGFEVAQQETSSISSMLGPNERLQTVSTFREVGFPGIAFRPQFVRDGVTDLRYSPRPGERDQEQRDLAAKRTPLAARLEAWGAQGGKAGGPYLTPSTAGTGSGSGWTYTQTPEAGRYPGGTSDGGILVLPPETNMADVDRSFSPAGGSVSTTYLAMGPGVRLGFGLPELASGGMKSAWSIRKSGDDLVLAEHSSVGAPTDRASIASGGYFQQSAAASVSASGTHSQGNGQLAAALNEISVAAADDVVTLPVAAAGRMVWLKNTSGANVVVYPSSGDSIDGGAADASVNLASGSSALYFAVNATRWYRLTGA